MRYNSINLKYLIFFIALFVISTMHFCDLKASTINYYDIVVDEDYELTNENLADIGLTISGKTVDYEQINIESVDENNYLLSYNDSQYGFVSNVELFRFSDVETPIQTQRHTLQVTDEEAIVNAGSNIAYCIVNNDVAEAINVEVNTASSEKGIVDGTVACTSDDITVESYVSVLNTEDESQYNISGQNVIYANSLHLIEDENINDLTDTEILDKISADSTSSNIEVISKSNTQLTISDDVLELDVSVIEDEAPEIETEPLYQVTRASNFDLLTSIGLSDDYTPIDDLQLTYDPSLSSGVNIKDIKIEDEYGNVTEEEIVVLVNDGNYIVSDSENYIYDNSLQELNYDENEVDLEVFSINDLIYQELRFDVVRNDSDIDEIHINDIENSYIDISSQHTSSNISIVLLIIAFVIVFLFFIILI